MTVEPAPAGRRTVDVLDELASRRATGALWLRGTDERIVLRDGQVMLVESPRSPSLDDTVVGTGRLDAAEWVAFKENDVDPPTPPPGMPVFAWERTCR